MGCAYVHQYTFVHLLFPLLYKAYVFLDAYIISMANFLFSVFGRQDSLEHLSATPRAVIISYQMLSRLRESMANRTWALMIVDESHNIRCTKKKEEKHEVLV
jgi:SNF2 family DNA or RNA helicase